MPTDDRVLIESPFAGDVQKNLRYVRACMADCFHKGESPYAPHALYTQDGVLNNNIPEERKAGVEAGRTWGDAADIIAIYTDLGISSEMKAAISYYEKEGTPIEYRTVPDWK